ncbi:hypothetical protein EON65_39465 [archaeon]|nr:MAG: hypothetical protein EON65_39465 [archaeon]
MQKFNDNIMKMLSLIRVETAPAPKPKPISLFDLVNLSSCPGGTGIQAYQVDLNSTLMDCLDGSMKGESSLGTTHLAQTFFVRFAIAALAKDLGMSEEQFLCEYHLENLFFDHFHISFNGTTFVVQDEQMSVAHVFCNIDRVNLCFYVFCRNNDGSTCDFGDGFAALRSSKRAALAEDHVLLPKTLRGTIPGSLLFSDTSAQEMASSRTVAPQDLLSESILAMLLDEALSRLGSVSFVEAARFCPFSFRCCTIRSDRVPVSQNFSYMLLCDPSLSIIDQVDIVLTDDHGAVVLLLEGVTMAEAIPLVFLETKAEAFLGNNCFRFLCQTII